MTLEMSILYTLTPEASTSRLPSQELDAGESGLALGWWSEVWPSLPAISRDFGSGTRILLLEGQTVSAVIKQSTKRMRDGVELTVQCCRLSEDIVR